jgi:hypothetical protein
MSGSTVDQQGVPSRRSSGPPLRRDPRVVFGVLAVITVILAAAISTALPRVPSASPIPAASPIASEARQPATNAPSSDRPAATALPDGWAPVALDAYQPVASLAATRAGAAGVATETAFTLISLAGADPAALATQITVQPEIDLAIATGPIAGSVNLRPTRSLAPGELYRFTLGSPDGTSLGSWAFQTAGPLRVVGTVPYDQATEVPTGSGIELTFDQDGALDAQSHFTIEPRVAGRFEQHGRTLVFVPDALQPATLYTVRLARGVSLAGTDQVLETDVIVRFETAATRRGPAADILEYRFGRPMIEVPTGGRPVIALRVDAWRANISDEEREALEGQPFDVEVFRLPSEAAGVAAARQVATSPGWARWSGDLVPTAALPPVGSFTVEPSRIGEAWGPSWIRLPVALEAGWYLLEAKGTQRDWQVVLQATDIAGYAAVTTDRMLVWANDIAAGHSLAGARVGMLEGSSLGVTDADGLLVRATPAAVATSPDPASGRSPAVTIRDRSGRSLVLLPGLETECCWGYAQDGFWRGEEAARDRWWLLLATDRQVFRPTDTVNVWGYIRDRDSAAVPASIRIDLTGGGEQAPPIQRMQVRPDSTGAFVATIPLVDLPTGGYEVDLRVDDEQVAQTWISVDEIRKPAFAIESDTDRHILIAGEQVRLTSRATFFDGTPVPGLPLTADLFGERRATTDRDGVATIAAKAAADADAWRWGGDGYTGISVRPALGEEAEIYDYSSLLVFPAAIRLDAEAVIEAGRVVVDGSLHQVAVKRLEAAWDTDRWDTVDRNGAAVAGAVVTARITELVPVKVKSRRVYDFITKQAVDIWEYRTDEVDRGSRTVRTGADGQLRLTFRATDDHDYRIVLSVRDSKGRTERLQVHATGPQQRQAATMPRLKLGCGDENDPLSIGDAICMTAVSDSGRLPSGGPNRYLFITAQRGLRDSVITTEPVHRTVFAAEDVPNLHAWAAWFTGTSIVPLGGSSVVAFDASDRSLTVDLAVDRERYAPGDSVALAVRTTRPNGLPIGASVVVRVVDEKLYAMGYARLPDPLEGLYGQVGSGLLWTRTSHPTPEPDTGGYGDTGGGGDGRSDFEDALLYRKVTTDEAGRADLSFRLSDDLTSWRVTAAAVTAVPEAGQATLLVPVGLPFFVEATIAPEYLVSDRPSLRLRAYGSGLTDGAPVRFTVSSTSLGMSAITVRGTAFEPLDVQLPALRLGEHALTIRATSGSGSAGLTDTLTRRFTVVQSRLHQTRTTYTEVRDGLHPDGGSGWTTYLFTDHGRGQYLAALQSLLASDGPRADQALAAAIARDLLISEFGVDPEQLPPVGFDPARYQADGIALLPYSSRDLTLTTYVALLAGERFDRDWLAMVLEETAGRPDATREERIQALAGLAGLGRPVLVQLMSAVLDGGLTARERLFAALGLAVAGDETSARAIERDLLNSYGRRRGPWIRLDVGGSPDDTVEATSMLALLAATLGDARATSAQAYVDANPAREQLHALQQAAFIARMLQRMPAEPARFAYTVDGQRSVVDLEAGASFSLSLVGDQRRTFSVELLEGSVGLSATWDVPLVREEVDRDPELELARTYTPYPSVPGDAMVEVRLTATMGPGAVAGCYVVTDLVPSGLAPLMLEQQWGYGDPEPDRYVLPYDIDGHRVSFCASPSPTSRTVKMRYFARVVTIGTYTWESAVIQSAGAPESINLTNGRRIDILR